MFTLAPAAASALRTRLLGLVVLAVACLTAGCAACRSDSTPAARDAALAPFVLVYLKSGPASGSGTPDERRAMFAGHMANMQRLAAEERLVIAGPFAKPRDKTWRGLQLFDVASVDEAQALAATDPGVIAGEFIAQCVPLRASPTLRQTLRLEREMEARAQSAGAPPRGEGAPPTVRAYVLVHAADVERALGALARTPGAPRVVWAARRADAPGAGLIALDAESADAVATLLKDADAGACDVDGWWSTVSLTGLPPEAGRV
jgi:uncharacterized protein YciI